MGSNVRPVRLRLSRRKGFDLQALSRATNGLEAVNCARPSVLGNPFIVGSPSGFMFEDGGDPTPLIEHLTLSTCLDLFEAMCEGVLEPEMHPWGHGWMRRFRNRHGCHPMEMIRCMDGVNFACWCPLPSEGEPDCCHAAVLLRLANPTRATRPDAPAEEERA